MLDLNNPQQAHADQRLRSDIIIWLSTVRPDGRPHTVPVWFVWDGSTILIFSQPNKQKLRNLQQNPNVVLALDNTHDGDDVIVLEGRAELLKNATIDFLTADSPYLEKYAKSITEIGFTPEQMAKSYSQPIRVTPTKFLGWQ